MAKKKTTPKHETIDYSKIGFLQCWNPETGEYTAEYNERQDSFGNPLDGLFHDNETYEAIKTKIDGGDQAEHLLFSFLSRGWDASKNLMIVEDSHGFKTKVESYRKQQLSIFDNLKDKKIAEYWQPFAAWLASYWASCPTPEYVAVTGHRRGMAILGTLYGKSVLGEKPTLDIPIDVRSFSDDLERALARYWENNTEDKAAYKTLDNLRIAQHLVSASTNAKQADCMVAGMNRGQAIKNYALASLDSKFPSVKLVSRMLMKEPDGYEKLKGSKRYTEGGYIPYKPFAHNVVQGWDTGVKQSTKQDARDPVQSAEELEALIKETVTSGSGLVSILPAKNRQAIATKNRCYLLRDAMTALEKGQQNWFDKLHKNAEACEAINALCIELGVVKDR